MTDTQALFLRATRFLKDTESSDDAVAIGLICDLATALTHALRGSPGLHAPTLEAAAKVADAAAATEWSEGGHYQRDDYQRGLREHAGHKLTQAAAAIRALAKREN